MYNYQLSRSVGAEGLIALTVIVQASAALLKYATPPFGRYAAEEQRLEGEYRFAHTRLLEHAEEVSLLRGAQTEKNIIERTYFSLIKHVNRVLRMRMAYALVEEGIVKWVWGSLGLCVCAVPVFGAKLVGLGSKASLANIDFGSRTEGASLSLSSFLLPSRCKLDIHAPAQALSRTAACSSRPRTLSAYVLLSLVQLFLPPLAHLERQIAPSATPRC